MSYQINFNKWNIEVEGICLSYTIKEKFKCGFIIVSVVTMFLLAILIAHLYII